MQSAFYLLFQGASRYLRFERNEQMELCLWTKTLRATILELATRINVTSKQARVRSLLNAITDVRKGRNNPLFAADASAPAIRAALIQPL
jgi:hypothetical protein